MVARLFLILLISSACIGNKASTNLIEVTREIEVTRQVEVTRIVYITKTPILPTITPTALPLQPADARASSYVGGNASPQFPNGEPGQLSVGLLGVNKDTIYIFVRNNTTTPVKDISVTAVVYSSDGNMYATSSGAQGFTPTFIRPGEISLGYIGFLDVTLPTDATYKFEVTADPSDSPEGTYDLDFVDVNLVENRLVGNFVNSYSDVIGGPYVSAFCFDETGNFLSFHGTNTWNDVMPNDQVPFQINLDEDQCPIYLVMASGYGR